MNNNDGPNYAAGPPPRIGVKQPGRVELDKEGAPIRTDDSGRVLPGSPRDGGRRGAGGADGGAQGPRESDFAASMAATPGGAMENSNTMGGMSGAAESSTRSRRQSLPSLAASGYDSVRGPGGGRDSDSGSDDDSPYGGSRRRRAFGPMTTQL